MRMGFFLRLVPHSFVLISSHAVVPSHHCLYGLDKLKFLRIIFLRIFSWKAALSIIKLFAVQIKLNVLNETI